LKLSLILSFNRRDLGDAFAMPIFGEFCGEPRAYDFTQLSAVDGLASQSQHVGAVVLARVTGHLNRITRCRSHSRNLIGSHGAANTSTVDDYPHFGIAFRDGASDRVRKVGVVNGVFGIGAKVMHAVPQLL